MIKSDYTKGFNSNSHKKKASHYSLCCSEFIMDWSRILCLTTAQGGVTMGGSSISFNLK